MWYFPYGIVGWIIIGQYFTVFVKWIHFDKISKTIEWMAASAGEARCRTSLLTSFVKIDANLNQKFKIRHTIKSI